MSAKKYALLIDVASIQKYIFGSNKLAENIGASYIIEQLVFKEAELEKLITSNKEGYIGGGNALVVFEKDQTRKKFTTRFKKEILNKYPGIKIHFGIYDDFDGIHLFKKGMKALHQSLRASKMLNVQLVETYKHGIAQECKLSNGVAEVEYPKKSNKFISASSNIKLQKAKKSNEVLNKVYKELLGDHWTFTTEIHQLGQPLEKSYVAVVHIDGNGIGQKFRDSKSLANTQILSKRVKTLSEIAMKAFIKKVVQDSEKLKDNKQFNFEIENGKTILPIRPIIAGGDDFTFVCEGKLGIHFAKELIQQLSTNEELKFDGKNLSACGGVAIVNTKFPFSKAYELAEELCQKAKNKNRENKTSDNLLCFMISRDGLTEDLEAIIDQQYTNKETTFFETYNVAKNGSFGNLIKQLKEFHQNESWTHGRIMELRSALYGSENEIKYFQEKFNVRKNENISIDNDDKVIFHDAIELYDFYPEELLTTQKTVSK